MNSWYVDKPFLKISWPLCIVGVISLGSLILFNNIAFANGNGASAQPKAAFYRYTMPDGRKEVGRQVPNEAVSVGYEVLDKRMRTIRKVRPALTKEEMAVKQRQSYQRESDEKLLQTFATSEDAERARDRKVAALDLIVNINNGNIARLNLEYETLAGVAAAKLRKGQEVPEHVSVNMASIDRQIHEAKVHIQSKEEEKEAVYQSYQPDIDRLKEIERGELVAN